MKKLPPFCVIACGMLVFSGSVARAATTETWSATPSDGNFSTPANWSTTTPVAGDSLAFGSSGTTSLTNDLTAGTSLADITFNSGASAFTIGGNSFALSGGILNSSTSTQTLNTAIVLSSAAHTIDTSTGNVALSGVISGTGGSLVKTGTGTLTLSNTANTFDGGIVIKSGTVNSAGNSGSYFGTGTITLGDSSGSANATLGHSTGGATITNNIIVASGNTGILSIAPTSGFDVYSGTITLGNNLYFANANNGNITISGAISGTGNLIINMGVSAPGSGVTLSGAQNFTGSITNNTAFSSSTPSGTVTISGTLGSGVTGITQNSNARMILNNNSTAYTGGVTITSGIVSLTNSNGAGTGTIAISSLGELQIGNSILSNAVTGTGTISIGTTPGNIGTNGTIAAASDLSGFTGTYTIATTGGSKAVINPNTAAGSTMNIASGATVFLGTNSTVINSHVYVSGTGNSETRGALRLNGGTSEFAGAVTLQGDTTVGGGGKISGIIDDGGNHYALYTAATSGGTTLTGLNTYSGGTFVTNGTMQTGTTGNFGTGNVTVSLGAALIAANNNSFNDLATLTFSSTSSTNSINLNFSGTDTLGAVYDSIAGLYLDAGTSYSASALNTFFGTSVFTGGGSLMVSAVPEPSTYALWMGAGALVILAKRRRTRRS
ncbi:MAG TPA: autotransporter-associated beta strand repeat-containing protein [Rariglobus sp.]|jgi:autotransporter-associated beta strand protein|nr:autotransporter-associated beta strand repeat-containing protein [Rariglobus sp.]